MTERGSIYVIGIGPGAPEHLTQAARQALEQAEVILGYHTYLDCISELAPHVPREASGMRQEVPRVKRAIELAQAGRHVALISSGDAGIYGMAGLLYELLSRRAQPFEPPVTVIPGVSALNASAALLGAPLMTDFAAISLSDQLTPLRQILQRVEAAAQADFVLCLYNPKSHQRVQPFEQACEILLRHRRPETPVGIVRAAYRPDQCVTLLTLAGLPAATVDMLSTVIVGNSQSYVHAGRLITPRGYAGKYDLGDEDGRAHDATTRN
jgi:precorrin-3B C17-methyltransferase